MPVTSTDIAWAAGVYEGEGSCTMNGYNYTSKRSGKTYRIESEVAKVGQKDKWLLQKLQSLFGGTVHTYVDRGHEISHWRLCGTAARGFLQTIYVFLSPRRQAQIRKLKFLREDLQYA